MSKFKVGDELRYRDWLGENVWEVSRVDEGDSRYKVTCIFRDGELCDEANTLSFTFVDKYFTLLEPANPNHITVSSLDYMDSTTLTDEDKNIIKEYLEHA